MARMLTRENIEKNKVVQLIDHPDVDPELAHECMRGTIEIMEN
jgi:hypothetical protein